MDNGVFLTISATGFTVAFLHAAIPTHWLPFVVASRAQKWSRSKTLTVTAIAGGGHVLLTTILGVLIVWLGLALDKKMGDLFPLFAGGALVLFGLYYLVRQFRGGGQGHHHFFGGHTHGHDHSHNSDVERGTHGGPLISTGHGFVEVSVFETDVPPRFRLYFLDSDKKLLAADTTEIVKIETVRPNKARQTFMFHSNDQFLESTSDIPEPHAFEVVLSIEHMGHSHSYQIQFTEDDHNHGEHGGHDHGEESVAAVKSQTSDWLAIMSLLALLTFSPCEGFLPVYLSGIQYGWTGFVLLSAILACATLAGMILFTWLALIGIEKLKLKFIEKYESAVLGGALVVLGLVVILFEH